MKKKAVMQTLKKMGFNTEQIDENMFVFHFEENPFLYLHDEKDEHLLRIAIPNIFDINEENELMVYRAMNEVELIVKYLKICQFHSSVWCFHEQLLDDDTDLEEAIQFSILLLNHAASTFFRVIEGEEVDNE